MENNDHSQIQGNSIEEKEINSESKEHKNNIKKPMSTAQKLKRTIVKKLSLDNYVKMLKNILIFLLKIKQKKISSHYLENI